MPRVSRHSAQHTTHQTPHNSKNAPNEIVLEALRDADHRDRGVNVRPEKGGSSTNWLWRPRKHSSFKLKQFKCRESQWWRVSELGELYN